MVPLDNTIVITATRVPVAEAQSPATVTVIDELRIGRLGEPVATGLARLVPAVAVAQSGATGTVAEVRIRGAEANHTLLFIDGIRANDPARGDAPRFELLNADLISRLEVVRGPQSALWGSQAIGGVVAVTGAEPSPTPAAYGMVEAGSYGFARTALRASLPSVAGALAFQRSSGIDIFGGGDRDGYRNAAGRLSASAKPAPDVDIGASGFFLDGRSEFDGPDPYTFERSHTLTSRDRMAAGGVWAQLGSDRARWGGKVSASRLVSRSRNAFEGEEINRTSGGRTSIAGQVQRRLSTGTVEHLLVAAAEHEREQFATDDVVYGGLTRQDQRRSRSAFTGEWRATTSRVTADLALRRDAFSRFPDATTMRASLLVNVGSGLAISGTYGTGIAQPTFFDLYGFFPGLFTGNPDLRPESSQGFEGALRYRSRRFDASLAVYRQRLRDEIVDVFASGQSTTANRAVNSRRGGVEAELGWRPTEALRLTAHYAFLDATQPTGPGSAQVREARRPRHSGSIAADGGIGPLHYGASLVYVGKRGDVNEQPPYQSVTLGSYWLGGARVGYRLRSGIELFARGSNLFDARYEDVFGYRTEGRAIHAGIRLGAGN